MKSVSKNLKPKKYSQGYYLLTLKNAHEASVVFADSSLVQMTIIGTGVLGGLEYAIG